MAGAGPFWDISAGAALPKCCRPSWAAKSDEPAEILRNHPAAAKYWQGLLIGALHGDEKTAGNTATTVRQAMSLFFSRRSDAGASARDRSPGGP